MEDASGPLLVGGGGAGGVELGTLPGGLSAPVGLATVGSRLVIAEAGENAVLAATLP